MRAMRRAHGRLRVAAQAAPARGFARFARRVAGWSRKPSSSVQVVPAAARPVSTPRWPPGAVASCDLRRAGAAPRRGGRPATGAIPSPRPGDRQHRQLHVGEVERAVLEREPAVGEVVGAEEAVVELAERAPGVGVHAVHERVDRLDLGEQLAVVQVGEHGPRLHQVLVEAGELVAALDQRRGRAAEQAVELRDAPALRDRRDRPQRRDQRHLREVERARDQRHAARPAASGRRASASSDRIPPRHQPTSCTGAAAGVLARGADRLRHDVLDPVLEAERAVGVLDLAVVDEVGRAARPQQVLGDRAAAAQVEADRGRGERRHEQHRLARAARVPSSRVVAAHGALRALVDHRRGHPAQVGEAAAERAVVEVGGRLGERGRA